AARHHRPDPADARRADEAGPVGRRRRRDQDLVTSRREPKAKVMQIDIVNIDGKKVGTADLSDAVFGAKVKDYLLWEVVKALRAQEKKIIVVDKLADAFEAPKTKRLSGILKTLGVKSAVVVDAAGNGNLAKSAHNLPKSKWLPPGGLNVYDILDHTDLVIAAD